MEGTKTAEVRTAFFELYIPTHHVDNINAVQKILNEALRDHGSVKMPS
jgi:hypothetical protein